MALAHLLVQVLEVRPQLADRVRSRQRAVARHDHLDVHREDPIARGDPVRHRPLPHDRVRAGEEDVPAEQHAPGGHVHERVAARMRGADLEQPQLELPDAQAQLAAERLLGQRELDAVEVERAEALQEERAQLAHLRRALDHRGHRRRRQLGHLRGGPLGGDDPRAVD